MTSTLNSSTQQNMQPQPTSSIHPQLIAFIRFYYGDFSDNPEMHQLMQRFQAFIEAKNKVIETWTRIIKMAKYKMSNDRHSRDHYYRTIDYFREDLQLLVHGHDSWIRDIALKHDRTLNDSTPLTPLDTVEFMEDCLQRSKTIHPYSPHESKLAQINLLNSYGTSTLYEGFIQEFMDQNKDIFDRHADFFNHWPDFISFLAIPASSTKNPQKKEDLQKHVTHKDPAPHESLGPIDPSIPLENQIKVHSLGRHYQSQPGGPFDQPFSSILTFAYEALNRASTLSPHYPLSDHPFKTAARLSVELQKDELKFSSLKRPSQIKDHLDQLTQWQGLLHKHSLHYSSSNSSSLIVTSKYSTPLPNLLHSLWKQKTKTAFFEKFPLSKDEKLSVMNLLRIEEIRLQFVFQDISNPFNFSAIESSMQSIWKSKMQAFHRQDWSSLKEIDILSSVDMTDWVQETLNQCFDRLVTAKLESQKQGISTLSKDQCMEIISQWETFEIEQIENEDQTKIMKDMLVPLVKKIQKKSMEAKRKQSRTNPSPAAETPSPSKPKSSQDPQDHSVTYLLAIADKLKLPVRDKPIQHALGDIKKALEGEGIQPLTWKSLLHKPSLARSLATQCYAIKVNEWILKEDTWIQEKITQLQTNTFDDQSTLDPSTSGASSAWIELMEPHLYTRVHQPQSLLKNHWVNQIIQWGEENRWDEKITAQIMKVGLDEQWYFALATQGSSLLTFAFAQHSNQPLWSMEDCLNQAPHVMEALGEQALSMTPQEMFDEGVKRKNEETMSLIEGIEKSEAQFESIFKTMVLSWAKKKTSPSLIREQWSQVVDLIRENPVIISELDRKKPLEHALNQHQSMIELNHLKRNFQDIFATPEKTQAWPLLCPISSKVAVMAQEKFQCTPDTQESQDPLLLKAKESKVLEQYQQWTQEKWKQRVSFAFGFEAFMTEEREASPSDDKRSKWDQSLALLKKGVLIEPLTCSWDLIHEGERMHHCVGGSSFINQGKENQAFFFHLMDRDTLEQSTLMVVKNGSQWTVEQHKGKYNASIKSDKIKSISSSLVSFVKHQTLKNQPQPTSISMKT